MLPPDTGRAMRARRLLDLAARKGLDREALLDRVGLGKTDVDHPDRRIPLEMILWLWRDLVEADPEPDLGIEVGRAIQVRETSAGTQH